MKRFALLGVSPQEEEIKYSFCRDLDSSLMDSASKMEKSN